MENSPIARLKNNNLKLRTISAVVLIPAVIALVYYGGVSYLITLFLLCYLMIREWFTMVKTSNLGLFSKIIWQGFGLLYCIVPCVLFSLIRMNSVEVMIWLLTCVWATDTGAYFAGISIGGPKIAPRISPKKTWSGLIGGILFSGFVGTIFDHFGKLNQYPYFEASLFLAVVSQLGDFFESWVKRYFNVKDSGKLIPGHGGILDRVDGLITASVVAWLMIVYFS
jgi:phosphatidate cytidylyltransferase